MLAKRRGLGILISLIMSSRLALKRVGRDPTDLSLPAGITVRAEDRAQRIQDQVSLTASSGA